MTYQKWRSIELSDFSVFIDSSLSSFSSFDTLETKVSMLNSVLLSGLDTFAPQKSRSVSFVCPAPWYNDDLRMMKTCRKMERKWRLFGLTVNYEAWKDCLQEYKVRIVSARLDYFSKMIDDNQRNPRQLFNSINKLLKCNSSLHVTASTHLCNKFIDFFATKIDNVRKGICASISLSSPSVNVSYSGTVFSNFCTLDSYSLQKEVSQMKPVTSLLDPIPTSLFQSCFASLCPVVLSIINDSLCTGVVSPSFKIAAVTPVPKKTNIDYENISYFRPISNLPFLVKILERVVASNFSFD